MGLLRRLPLAFAGLILLAGCTTESPGAHDPGPRLPGRAGARVSLPVGDGRHRSESGYTLRDVRLPPRAGKPGRLSFVVENDLHRPQTRFLLAQTKKIHVYVVRADLAVYRHVHPVMTPDGSWSTNLTLPEPGSYRVVTDFVARDQDGGRDHVVLGGPAAVPGGWAPRPVPAADGVGADWGVHAEVLDDPVAGREQAMVIRIRRRDGGTPRLGTYLGTSAHVVGFQVRTGAVAPMRALGAPREGDGRTDLVLDADFPAPGTYVLFLQVRVDDFLHTVPVQVRAR